MIHETPSDRTDILLELGNISKSFPGVQALDGVSLKLRAGEVQALLGENGAGKSTLIKIVAGVYHQDEGTYKLYGDEVTLSGPRDASSRGIGVVHQERNMVPTFTVGENVLLNSIVGRSLQHVDRRRINSEAQPYMDMVGLGIAPSHDVEGLSPAQKQLVEIARALATNSRIVLLDEPTASIASHEVAILQGIIRHLRDQGVAILYVTHKLEEVFETCDTVTVLRDGRNTGPKVAVRTTDTDKLVIQMIGRSQFDRPFRQRDAIRDKPVLEADRFVSEFSPFPCTFSLLRGEILGWYGLVGSGRTELARAIIGADVAREGSTHVNGEVARIHSVAEALHHWRIGYVSENRQEDGLVLIHSVTRNIAITIWRRLQRLGLLDGKAELQTAKHYQDALGIRTPSLRQEVVHLSGGNQQKVSVAKWLASKCEILIIDEPTVGIDVGTRDEIHSLVRELAESGVSIILISSDMREMVRLADRILIFVRGQIVDEMPNSGDYTSMSQQIMRRLVVA